MSIIALIIYLLIKAIQIYEIILAIYCILSFFPMAYGTKLFAIIYKIVDPLLAPLRKIPFLRIALLDLTPFALFIILQLAQWGVLAIGQMFYVV